MHGSQRICAALVAIALASGCAVTRNQRTGLVVTGAVVTAATAAWAVSFMLQECDSAGAGSSQQCEDDRISNRNTVATVSLIALGATIVAQLLPVSNPERPPPPPVAIAPPPPPPLSAIDLHDPVAVKLAAQAREFAAAGRCNEAYGSLKALTAIDRGLADQLRSWDPAVSRCQKASDAAAAGAVTTPSVGVTVEGAPGSTAPPPTPSPSPSPSP